MTDAEARKLVAVLLGAYPSARVTPDTATVYERMLRDLEYPVANAAVERLLATSKFMPSIAEIREAALALTRGEVKPGGEAWGEFLDAVGRVGAYRIPRFEDPLVARVVESLGWRELCLSEDQTADRARFIELYDKLASQDRREQASGQLPAAQRLRELQERNGGGTLGELVVGLLPKGDA